MVQISRSKGRRPAEDVGGDRSAAGNQHGLDGGAVSGEELVGGDGGFPWLEELEFIRELVFEKVDDMGWA